MIVGAPSLIAPKRTLDAVYPSGVVLDNRPTLLDSPWTPRSHWEVALASTKPLSILGNLALVCRATAAETSAFFTQSGLSVARPPLATYDDEADYVRCLRRLVASGNRIAFQHRQPSDLIPLDSHVVHPDVLSFLNDKKNLELLTGGHFVAPRRVGTGSQIRSWLARGEIAFPIVLKVVGDAPATGGRGVAICAEMDNFEAALNQFAAVPEIACEKFVHHARSLCVQFAIRSDGTEYLGATEQITDARGRYLGNWIDPTCVAPAEAEAAGHAIGCRASAMGYIGVLGIDILLGTDRAFTIVDLNFRLNGSTPGLLLHEAVAKSRDRHFTKVSNWALDNECAARAGALVGRGDLIPLAMASSSAEGSVCWLHAIIAGSSREHVLELERELLGDTHFREFRIS